MPITERKVLPELEPMRKYKARVLLLPIKQTLNTGLRPRAVTGRPCLQPFQISWEAWKA